MVRNGIEYGDMQLICEAYQLMSVGLGMSADEMHAVLPSGTKGVGFYLVEITRDILGHKDDDGSPLVDKILDTAGQGTGKWTVISSADLGIPITLIAEAVYNRCVSAMKEERVAASKNYESQTHHQDGPSQVHRRHSSGTLCLQNCVLRAGYMLLRAAAKEYNWKLNYGGIALMWRGGCIIRSQFLGKIKEAYDKRPRLANLMLDPHFKREIRTSQKGWRNVIATAVKKGIPVPAFATALNFYDSYRSERLPANLLQAQRDYFGAHTYERVDKPRGEFFHTNWTGTGGRVSSSTYTV